MRDLGVNDLKDFVCPTSRVKCNSCIKRQMQDELDYMISEAEIKSYNQALEDVEKRYREWSKSEYGRIVSDDALSIRVLRSLIK